MKYKLFIAFVIGVLSVSCNNTKHRTFSELDKRIQDTLLKQESDIYGCYPDLIDFTGNYKIIHKTFGPWTYRLIVLNVSTGKSYGFAYNTPTPFIITTNEIIHPKRYNILSLGIEPTDTFVVIKIN